jgi:ribosome maturation factor RimP
MADDSLEREIEARVEALGYEFVELERTGSAARPILRLRIDVAPPEGSAGVSIEDCARVSRALEPYLDEHANLGTHYVLEVSSPGLERPLVRRRDFERFAGREVALKGHTVLAERAKRLEGELLGVVDGQEGERVRVRLADEAVVEIPRAQIARAHLVFRWDKS